jgi:hypothetical protein
MIAQNSQSAGNAEANTGSEGGLSTTGRPPEVSVVIPCLNEADTLANCIQKASKALGSNAIQGEIIVADNGSTDGCVEIATKMGARIVPVELKGYGNALMGGISQAKGKFIIMGDAKASISSRAVDCLLAEAASCPEQCLSYIAGWETPSSRRLPGDGFTRPSTTSIAGCAALRRRFTIVSTSGAPGWSLQRR